MFVQSGDTVPLKYKLLPHLIAEHYALQQLTVLRWKWKVDRIRLRIITYEEVGHLTLLKHHGSSALKRAMYTAVGIFMYSMLELTSMDQSRARFFERHYNFNGMLVGCNIPLADLWVL